MFKMKLTARYTFCGITWTRGRVSLINGFATFLRGLDCNAPMRMRVWASVRSGERKETTKK